MIGGYSQITLKLHFKCVFKRCSVYFSERPNTKEPLLLSVSSPAQVFGLARRQPPPFLPPTFQRSIHFCPTGQNWLLLHGWHECRWKWLCHFTDMNFCMATLRALWVCVKERIYMSLCSCYVHSQVRNSLVLNAFQQLITADSCKTGKSYNALFGTCWLVQATESQHN